nr:right-handed parallel beta-helix repeat-containing protein [Methanobrevibacter sp. TMH8]
MIINKNITIQGKIKDKVILDAQNLGRIFTIDIGYNVTFINITFINGNITGSGHDRYAGAIYTYNLQGSNTLILINCSFINNKASTYGGAIAVNGKLTMVNCIFINNSAYYAGAAYILGFNSSVINSTFLGNNAYAGGAVTTTGPNFTIVNSTFTSNNAYGTNGGAISSTGSNLSVNNCNFENNTASNRGGAIVSTGSNNTISNSNFTGNNATTEAGAIFITGTNITVINNTIINNTSINGSGIGNYANNAIISRNKISNNNGDAIINNGQLTLSDNIILNNSGYSVVNYGVLNPLGVNNIMDISQNELSFISVDVSANKVTITVKATGNNGSLIVGRTINFYVNGVLVGSVVTNGEGIAELTYTVSNYGQQNIVASLDEFNETFDFEGIVDFAIRLYPGATNSTSVNVVEEKVPDNSTPDDDTPTSKPDIDPRPNPDTIPEHINDPNDNPVAKAAMKNTGIPIAILLIIALLGVVSYRRKN